MDLTSGTCGRVACAKFRSMDCGFTCEAGKPCVGFPEDTTGKKEGKPTEGERVERYR